MFEQINEPVNVLAGFVSSNTVVRVTPHLMDWRGTRYRLGTMGLHHPAPRGSKYCHIFEFSAGNTKFKVELNTETLVWTLTEVYHDYST